MQQLSQDAAKSNIAQVIASVSGGLAGLIAFLVVLMAGLDLVIRVFGLNLFWGLFILIPVASGTGLAAGFTMYRGWFFANSLYPNQVYDYGDYLVVESNGERKRVCFTKIIDVSFSYLSPMKVSITMLAECEQPPIVFLPNHQIGVRKIVRSLKERAAMTAS